MRIVLTLCGNLFWEVFQVVADRLSQLQVFLGDSWDGMDNHLINPLRFFAGQRGLRMDWIPVLQQHDTSSCRLLLLADQELDQGLNLAKPDM